MELKNKIKISLFLGDVENSFESIKRKEKFFTVHSFDYTLLKSRHELGTPSEITERTILNFEVRSPKISELQALYGMMKIEETSLFSFVFNPVFGENACLEGHGGAMVIEGCLCSINELYVSHGQEDKRILLSASLIIYSLRYVGGENNVTPLSLKLI